MRYWNDMRSKYGFGDGGMVPSDAEAARALYVRVVNLLAEEHKSAVRVTAYDRSGLHNWCLIEFVPVGAEPDDGMRHAIDEADEMDLDECIALTVVVDEKMVTERLQTKQVTP